MIEIGAKKLSRCGTAANEITQVVEGSVSPKFLSALSARRLDSEYDACVLIDAGVFVCGTFRVANPGR